MNWMGSECETHGMIVLSRFTDWPGSGVVAVVVITIKLEQSYQDNRFTWGIIQLVTTVPVFCYTAMQLWLLILGTVFDLQ